MLKHVLSLPNDEQTLAYWQQCQYPFSSEMSIRILARRIQAISLSVSGRAFRYTLCDLFQIVRRGDFSIGMRLS